MEYFAKKKGINLSINESFLFGCTIENLFTPPPPYIRYDIGDPQEREFVVNKIESVLYKEVMKAFSLIESPEDLELYLKDNTFPAMQPFNSINDYFSYIKEEQNQSLSRCQASYV